MGCAQSRKILKSFSWEPDATSCITSVKRHVDHTGCTHVLVEPCTGSHTCSAHASSASMATQQLTPALTLGTGGALATSQQGAINGTEKPHTDGTEQGATAKPKKVCTSDGGTTWIAATRWSPKHEQGMVSRSSCLYIRRFEEEKAKMDVQFVPTARVNHPDTVSFMPENETEFFGGSMRSDMESWSSGDSMSSWWSGDTVECNDTPYTFSVN